MKIQSIYKSIGEYGCLALNYLWAANISYSELANHFNDLLEQGIIDKECTVNSARAFYKYFGVNATVIKSDTAPTDNSKYIGKFSKGDYSHFVGMQNGKVINNTLDFSNCVSEGTLSKEKPFRIIHFN
jgi:hypothetical protein